MHLHVCCTAGPTQPQKGARPQPRVVGMKAHHLPACKKTEQRRRVIIFRPVDKRIEMKGDHLLACRKMNRIEGTTPFGVNSLTSQVSY